MKICNSTAFKRAGLVPARLLLVVALRPAAGGPQPLGTGGVTSSGQSPHRSPRPDGQVSLRSLAPPLPNGPASLGSIWVPYANCLTIEEPGEREDHRERRMENGSGHLVHSRYTLQFLSTLFSSFSGPDSM